MEMARDRGTPVSNKSSLTRIQWVILIVCGIFLYSLIFRNGLKENEKNESLDPFAEKLPQYLKDVNTLYVIPGGGSGAGVDNVKNNYPEWSRRRVVAAFEHSKKHSEKGREPLFLALSAGSLNTPNSLHEDGRIKFECQHMIEHLVELGVPKNTILGDFMSWDTVTNALFLRMVIDGIMVAQKSSHLTRGANIFVEVFISDFHADRVEAAFQWVLGLQPSVLSNVKLTINKVSSEGIKWPSESVFADRLAHEVKGVQQIRENGKIIKSVSELHAFLLLGPHKGFFDYMHHALPAKVGGGW